MLTAQERLLMNGALLRLAEGTNVEEAANEVIKFAKKIPFVGTSAIEVIHTHSAQEPPVTGHAAGVGDVEIEGKKESKTNEWRTYHVERVGYFKVEHYRSGIIEFRHFWKSDLTTSTDDERPLTYRVDYNPSTGALVSVGILNDVVQWQLALFGARLIRFITMIEPIYGNPHKTAGTRTLLTNR